jgi:hypothetical protein
MALRRALGGVHADEVPRLVQREARSHRGRHVPDPLSGERPADAREARAGVAVPARRPRAVETKPDYLYFHPWAYRAGIAYERLVNRFDALARFRVQPIADLEAI